MNYEDHKVVGQHHAVLLIPVLFFKLYFFPASKRHTTLMPRRCWFFFLGPNILIIFFFHWKISWAWSFPPENLLASLSHCKYRIIGAYVFFLKVVKPQRPDSPLFYALKYHSTPTVCFFFLIYKSKQTFLPSFYTSFFF